MMYKSSLSDQPAPERLSALISLTKYGPIFPCYGVALLDGAWSCECGKATCKHRVGKHPRVLWSRAATKDAAQIAKWSAKWPMANWAIVTGVDIDVVDLDVKPGKPNGMITLTSWGDCDSVTTPDSVRVSTSGGGRHLYFLPGSGLKTTSNPDGTGIDVRAAGGYVMAPGSRHKSGEVYQLDLDKGLEACPAWLVERISGKNRPNGINRVTIPIHSGGGMGVGGAQRFRLDAELSLEEWARINDLRARLPKFTSTWASARATSPWPFREGRNSPSEYEASIAFFLVWDGWSEQSVMSAICAWRRACGLEAPTQYSRYACTLRKAFAMVTPRSKGLGEGRKEIKGAWKHGYTRDQILSCIIETPRSARQIADVTGIDLVNVKVVIGRLRKDGKVVRNDHMYLCAPTAVPWYLQNIPENVGEPTVEELEAEYEAWLSAGGLEAVEESIEAPEMFTPAAAAAVIKATMPDFDEPELVTAGTAYPLLTECKAQVALDTRNRLLAARDDRRALRARPNYNSPADLRRFEAAKKRSTNKYSFLLSQLDPDIDRLNELDRVGMDDGTSPF